MSANPSRKCQQRRVVVGQSCRIDQCSHGTVYVHVGDVTLRFQPDTFQEVATAFGVAAQRIDSMLEPGRATRLLC